MRAAARQCAGHPALFGYSIGNEIPRDASCAGTGAGASSASCARLYDAVKSQDPAALVTYVNFPTTEYLHLPFLDFACFNVYLESRERFEAYLARLQNLAGERPLVMAEIGLDSRRNRVKQHRRKASTGRCAPRLQRAARARSSLHGPTNGTAAAWRSKTGISGLTTRVRDPKPALAAVRKAYARGALPRGRPVAACERRGLQL